jgi:hypothetical protein
VKRILFTIIILAFTFSGFCQKKNRKESNVDSTMVAKIYMPLDSLGRIDSIRKSEIRRITRRSAIVPGWGQINNKQAYKVPVIYGGLGFITYLFFDNLNTYRELRQAFIYMSDTIPGNDDLIPEQFRPLSPNSVRFYRDQFRQNVDYSVLAFIILWGLNVVDATVFAHLRDFDVSDELSMKIKTPNYNLMTGQGQVGLLLSLKPPSKTLKPLPAR